LDNYFILLFTLPEIILLIAKRSKRSLAKAQNDGKSLLILWVTISTCMSLAYIFSLNHVWLSGSPNALEMFGILLFVLGFVIRWVSVFQLGRMFTVDVSISRDHVLKTDGLYRMVRHPSYLGLFLILAGISLLLNNAVSCVIIVPVFMAINYRISVEEKALLVEFGNQYSLYTNKVKKILPLIY
jgi:protein-S-isoprenylcysteine O-methyltransferase Ste14